MPYLELFHDMNAWDNMMQEAARDYDPSRTLPIVPDARKDHAQRMAERNLRPRGLCVCVCHQFAVLFE